jgi:heterodisulfide reductase subunit A
LNKYLFEMANIRNQGSWVHSHEPQKATQRAKDQVRMAVAKAALLEPLTESRLSILPKAMVIGGGISGMTAALEFSRQGFLTHLVERDNVLGGNARFLTSTQNGEDIQVRLTELINQIKNDPNISLHLGTTIEKVEGFVGNFNSTLRTDQNSESVEHGVCVIATGAKEHQPTGYLHGKDPRVKTHLELDAALLNQEIDPKKCKSIVFIQCVGSREPERPYCSKVCCTHSVKKAIQFKENNPKCKVTVLYRDMRTYGEREFLYQKARKLGVLFVRYDPAQKPSVEIQGNSLKVVINDHVLDRPVEFTPDLLVLASAIESLRDESLARMFKIALDQDGWFQEAHVKLRPVDFATDGVFMAGLAHYPKPVEEAVAQAQAAVSRAATVLSQKEIWLSGQVAAIDQSKCTGCGVCWTVCPYQAIEQDENGLAKVRSALCKGCGTCAASCRSGAPNLLGFSSQDVLAQVAAMLNNQPSAECA